MQSKSNGKPAKKEPSASGSEDDLPLAKKAATNGANGANGHAKRNVNYSDSDSDSDDQPLVKKKQTATKSKAGAKVKKEVKSDSESEDEKPLAKKAAPAKKAPKVKAEKPAAVKKEKKVKEEEDEDKYKWWEQEAGGDGSVKWTTLEHNAVLFPPAYVPLPKDVKMKYDGVPLTLPPESEEVAGFFGAMLNTDHAQDAVFRQNFFRDFKDIVEKYPPKENIKITSFDKCDFTPMLDHFEREKEKKKAMSKEEKKA